jgi:hypothetical protein
MPSSLLELKTLYGGPESLAKMDNNEILQSRSMQWLASSTSSSGIRRKPSRDLDRFDMVFEGKGLDVWFWWEGMVRQGKDGSMEKVVR